MSPPGSVGPTVDDGRVRNDGSASRAVLRLPKLTYRRRTELGLLTMAAVVTVGGYVLVDLGAKGKIPADLAAFCGIIVALSLVAHLATRWLAPQANPVMLPIVALLNGLGFDFIARISASGGPYAHETQYQAAWTAVGVLAYVVTLAVIRRTVDLERFRYLVALAGVGLLLLPLVPKIGLDINGARLWIHVGTLTFQPVELAKLALCFFFASYLVEKRELLSTRTMRVGNHLYPDPRALGPIAVAWGFAMVVIMAERDIGFAALLFVTFITMLWLTTGRFTYLAVGLLLFAVGAWFASQHFGQVSVRITTWLDPWKTPLGSGYQVVQSQYALGSGGVGGLGLGLGHPQLIPVASTDFIFSIIGEELGLLGTTTMVFAFVLLVGAGIRTALAARSDFARLTAAGLTTIVGFQAFFIMGGITRLLPLTGVTLPFVAYGGSALISNYILVAVLMRISNETDETAARERAELSVRLSQRIDR